MTRRACCLVVAGVLWSTSTGAQTAAVQVTQSGGASSESVLSVATQLRALAEPVRNIRLTGELAWGNRSSGFDTDVFGTAYPYAGEAYVMEAWAEYVRPRGRGLRAVRTTGRYRTPFGISAASDG